jgi:hypothetical protein
VLAYLFWHRPRTGVDPDAYEEAQRIFHRELGADSACFRLSALPFAEDGGYEDWYLVGDWAELSELNERAVDERRRPHHDEAAELAGDAWGGVYSVTRGAPLIPVGAEWTEKPRGEPAETFIAGLDAETVWRRELVLGPAPEFCFATSASVDREPIWLGPRQ